MNYILALIGIGLCIYIFDFILVYFWILLQKIYSDKKRGKNDKGDSFYNDRNKKKTIKEIIKNCLNGLELLKIKQVGRIPSHNVRMTLYKFFGMKIQRKVSIYGECEFRGTRKIQIGEGTIIGNKCSIDGRNGICIGKNVNMSTGVSIWTEQHDTQDSFFACNVMENKMVKIGDRAWLSNNCIILPGVEVKQGAVIAAGAVVTKDVGAFEIWGGVPAQKIGNRNHNLQYEFDGDHFWFI